MKLPRLKDVTAVVGFISLIFGVVKWVAGDDADPTLILYSIGSVSWGLYGLAFVFVLGAVGAGLLAAKLGMSGDASTAIGLACGIAFAIGSLVSVESVRYLFLGDYERDGAFDRALYTITGLAALAVPAYLYHRSSESSA